MKNTKLLENELLNMSYRDRLNAIADDLTSGNDKYRDIEPYRFAELAGLTPPPLDDGWTHIYYIPHQDFDELVINQDAEIVFRCAAEYLKGKVDVAILTKIEDALSHYENGNHEVDISFLTSKEKKLIELGFMEQELQSPLQQIR